MGLTCISLMTSGARPLPMCSLAICVSLEKCLFSSHAAVKTGLFVLAGTFWHPSIWRLRERVASLTSPCPNLNLKEEDGVP